VCSCLLRNECLGPWLQRQPWTPGCRKEVGSREVVWAPNNSEWSEDQDKCLGVSELTG
jgi:hypothetical protein